MGSQIPLKLPVIDFSNIDLNGGGPQWDAVKSQVHRALLEFGCFEVLFNRVPLELHKATFAALKELFDLPLQTKQQNVLQTPFHGYLEPKENTNRPLYESMGIVDANVIDKLENFTNIMWPQGNPAFSKTIQSISETLSVLDQITRKMVLESLGLEKYMEEHMNSTFYIVRVMKYEAPQTNEKKVGLGTHTDKSVVTVLCQDLVEGLEIQTKDGNWINTKPSPNSFIVLVGEFFHAWTNGRLHPPIHRVMISGNEVRYSLGLFTNPKREYIVKVPEELVDEKHPLLFKPFNYIEFLKYCAKKGYNAESTLSAYCGV